MLRAQRLRRCTWRLNGVLAVAAVCAGLAAARALQHPLEPFEPRSVELDVEHEPAWRGEHLPPFDELMEAIHAFHRPAGEAALDVLEGTQATRLALGAFRVSVVVGSREDPCITLVSKDPRHDERYCLMLFRPDRDARLVAARFEADVWEFDVRRGQEAFTFRAERHARPSSIVRPLDRPRADATEHGNTSSTARPGAMRALKVVTFYGPGGRVSGVRVTGVRPDSWAARRGLQAGDVIRNADESPVSSREAFASRLHAGWRPAALTVARGGRVRTLQAGS